MKFTNIEKALQTMLNKYDDVLSVASYDDKLVIVVLTDGTIGEAWRKKGDVNKPFLAAKLAYFRAKAAQVLEKL